MICLFLKRSMPFTVINHVIFLSFDTDIKPASKSDYRCYLNNFGINLTFTLSFQLYISTDLYEFYSLEKNCKQ